MCHCLGVIFCLSVYFQQTGGAHLTADGHTLTGGANLTGGAEHLIRPKMMRDAGLKPTTSRFACSFATTGLEGTVAHVWEFIYTLYKTTALSYH